MNLTPYPYGKSEIDYEQVVIIVTTNGYYFFLQIVVLSNTLKFVNYFVRCYHPLDWV